MRTLTPEQALACATGGHALSSPGSSIDGVAERIVGLHNTSQVSPYLSLHARLERFERSDLDELMWGRWELARFRAMRLTMFIFPIDLLEVAAAATRHLSEPFAARWLRDSGLTSWEFERLCDAIVEALSDGPLTSRQLRKALRAPQEIDLPGIVSRLCDVGKVVGGAPPGSWRSNVRRFHLASDVLPDVDFTRWSETPAIAELIHRYVRGYGPVTLSDMAWWSGLSKARCRQALETLGGSIREVVVDDWPGPLYVASDADFVALRGFVKALPLLDPYVQGYWDRERFLDSGLSNYVHDGGGNSSATIVVDGRIVGVWQPVTRPLAIRYHLFGPYPAGLRRDLEQELLGASSIYFDQPVDLIEVSKMQPLTGPGGSRSAMHPLDGVLHRPG